MEHTNLLGSDDVYKAGYMMQSAASDMRSAASTFDESLRLMKIFMEDWLQRFELIVKEVPHG